MISYKVVRINVNLFHMAQFFLLKFDSFDNNFLCQSFNFCCSGIYTRRILWHLRCRYNFKNRCFFKLYFLFFEVRSIHISPSDNFYTLQNFELAFVGLGGPIALDVFENNIYWTSKDDGAVYRQDKFGRGIKTTLREGLRSPTSVKTYHPRRYDVSGNARDTCLFLHMNLQIRFLLLIKFIQLRSDL